MVRGNNSSEKLFRRSSQCIISYNTSKHEFHYHAMLCTSFKFISSRCHVMQRLQALLWFPIPSPSAISCSAITCHHMQSHAITCNHMQSHAITCNPVQAVPMTCSRNEAKSFIQHDKSAFMQVLTVRRLLHKITKKLRSLWSTN
mgnify:CR=1 FL=1